MQKENLRPAAEAGQFPSDIAIAVKVGSGKDAYPTVCAFITDVEYDVVFVEFGSDGTIRVDASDISYFILDEDILRRMSKMAPQALRIWDKLYPHLDDKSGRWSGYEHLVTEPS